MGDIFGGGSGAEESAGAAQRQEAEAYRQSVLEQQRQFDINKALLEPFREQGVSALNQQMALAELLGEEQQADIMSSLDQIPGSQYLQEQQERALLADAAATGKLGGGDIQKALAELAVNQGIGQQADLYNQLGNLSGTAASAGQSVSNLGLGTAGSITNQAVQQGQSAVQNILGQQAIRSAQQQNMMNLLGSGVGAISSYMMASPSPNITTVAQGSPMVGGIGSQGTPMANWRQYMYV